MPDENYYPLGSLSALGDLSALGTLGVINPYDPYGVSGDAYEYVSDPFFGSVSGFNVSRLLGGKNVPTENKNEIAYQDIQVPANNGVGSINNTERALISQTGGSSGKGALDQKIDVSGTGSIGQGNNVNVGTMQGNITQTNSTSFNVFPSEEVFDYISQIDQLNEKLLNLKGDAEKQNDILKKLYATYSNLVEILDAAGITNVEEAKLYRDAASKLDGLKGDLEARGVRISELEKSNEVLQKRSDLQQNKIGFLFSTSMPLARSFPKDTVHVQNPASIAMPAPRTEQEQRAIESQMIMQRHGPFRMYDEGTETFLRDYTDPENYSDRYNRLAERRERGHNRMVGLLNAGMITDTDLGWYDAKTQEKLANQYRADNVDPDWLAQQQQAAKDTREANRYAMQQQRAQNREDIREARQETRDANRMARRHALGGTLLSDYNSAGWRFDGYTDLFNLMNTIHVRRNQVETGNPGYTGHITVYGNAPYFYANLETDKEEGDKVYNAIGEWIDGHLKGDTEELISTINNSSIKNGTKKKLIKQINAIKDLKINEQSFKNILKVFKDRNGYDYNSALTTNASGSEIKDFVTQTGDEDDERQEEKALDYRKILANPDLYPTDLVNWAKEIDAKAKALDGGNAGSETETDETQTGASSFIPYDNSDVDFNALYDPEGEYMKAIKWIESNPDSELARDLMARINGGEYGPLNGHEIKTDNFRQLATDSKRGPVHNAVMGLIGGDSPLWKDAKYKYETAPWGNVVVKEEPPVVKKEEEAADGKDTETPEEKAAREAAEREAALKAQEKGDETHGKLPTWMRYAPIAASAMGLLNPQLYRKDYTNANFLRNMANSLPDRKVRFRENLAKMRYTPVDRNMLTNTQNANMAAAMRGASGSNAGNAMAYNLALLKTGNESIGSQYAQTAAANNQMYNQAMQFNNAVNQANAQGNFTAQTTNAQLGQQRDAMRNNLMSQYVQYREAADNGRNRALSTQLNSLSNNLGELGMEFYNRNAVAGLPLVYGTDLNGNPYYRGQQTGSGSTVPFVLFPQTQTAQTTPQAAAPADGSVTLTKEQVDALTPEQKTQFGIPKAYGSFLRPYYRRA